MFVLRLVDVNQARIRIISSVASLLQISLPQAKHLVDMQPENLLIGDARRIAYARKKLQEAGASVRVDYYPDGMNPQSWVAEQYSTDKSACAQCGEQLFYVVPGRTTEAEIRLFLQSKGKFAGDEQFQWMHPGVYCPNDCFFVMVNLEHPDQYSGELS